MKKILFFALTIVLQTQLSAQNYSDPVKYNDYIVGLQDEIGNKIIAFNEQMSIDGTTYESIMPYYKDLVNTAKSCLTKIEKLDGFKKETALRDAAVDLFRFYERCFSGTYGEMLKIAYQTDLSTADATKLSQMIQEITDEESGFDKKFQQEQGLFAKKYNFDLKANQLQKKIDD